MNRREFNQRVATAIAALVSPFSRASLARAGGPSGGATPVFSYPNGFSGSANAINVIGDGVLSGSIIRLINNPGHDSAGAYYATKLPPTAFTTQFTFQPSGLGTSATPAGMTFCINNVVSPPGQSGYTGDRYYGDANMCGYGGAVSQTPPLDSVMIKFDAGPGDSNAMQSYPAGGLPSSTGLYFNGGPSTGSGAGLGLCPFNDLNPYGINFYSGHIFQVTIVYDGRLITAVILDTTTNAQARFAWPLNLANTTNPAGNYVGFTAGTAKMGLFELLSWTYWSGYNPRLATPQFSVPPGEYSGTQTVRIRYPEGSACYYTTNGLLPTSSSTRYTGPITVSGNQVIQAVAIQSGHTDSLVATGTYQIDTPNVINFPSGFAAGDLIPVGFAYLSGSAIHLCDRTTSNACGAAWFPAPVTVSSFSTAFTLQWGASGQGMCFVLQNDPPPYPSPSNAINWSGGPTVVGAPANALGYGGLNAINQPQGTSYGILNSVAVAFNQIETSGDPANSVGVYTNGQNPSGSQIVTGLNFSSGNPFDVTLTYSGSTLMLTMTDTVAGTTFTHSFTVDIASMVGATTAYVGFTGGTGGAYSLQSVQAWTYTANPGSTPGAPASVQAR